MNAFVGRVSGRRYGPCKGPEAAWCLACGRRKDLKVPGGWVKVRTLRDGNHCADRYQTLSQFSMVCCLKLLSTPHCLWKETPIPPHHPVCPPFFLTIPGPQNRLWEGTS